MGFRSLTGRSESVSSLSSGGQSHKKQPSLQGKNDPNLALTEAQPMANTGSTLHSLNRMQHFNQLGQPITEPDLSNPTRYRFERPLETIKSFEAAIARTHKERHNESISR